MFDVRTVADIVTRMANRTGTRTNDWAIIILIAVFLAVVYTKVTGQSISPVPQPTTTALVSLGAIPVRERVTVAGYQRGCGTGQACSFGPAWIDDTDAPGGRDGCGTRDDVLAAQLTHVVKKGSCVVVSGTLADPYTGKTVQFTKANASTVAVDHVVPLAYAWDMGAAEWPQARRNTFANDEAINLLAVSGPANSSKSDKGPAGYMPAAAYACAYAARWVTVATTYNLSITPADKQTLTSTLAGCPA